MLSKIRFICIQVLPIAVLLAGFALFAKAPSVFANGLQSTDASTVALTPTNKITFTLDHGLDGEVGGSAIVAGDFNRDGQVDVAIANNNFGGVTVRLGVPDFQNDSTYFTGAGANEVLTADFNHDGHLDLAVANADTNTVSILLGNSRTSLIL